MMRDLEKNHPVTMKSTANLQIIMELFVANFKKMSGQNKEWHIETPVQGLSVVGF